MESKIQKGTFLHVDEDGFNIHIIDDGTGYHAIMHPNQWINLLSMLGEDISLEDALYEHFNVRLENEK